MKRYAIYLDARPGHVNYDSFDGTYVWKDVAMRSDEHGRKLAGAIRFLKREPAALGVFLDNGLYIERYKEAA
jgi:hypothetical protein